MINRLPEVTMTQSYNRWAAGVAAAALLGLTFYGLRTEQPRPAQLAQHTTIPTTAASSPSSVTPAAAPAATALPNFVDLVQAVKPAVVSIRVKSEVTPQVTADDGGGSPFEGTPFERFFRQFGQPGQDQGRDQRQGRGPSQHFYAQGQGSGFFVSADGYVVTNNHVVANAVKVDVVMDDGTALTAKVVGTDPKTDVALVKVEGRRTDFPFVAFADTAPRIGEWVIAMGNPFGLGGTVTSGIVSAQGRDIGSGPYDDFMQIDAAVNRGNSGGPTFNTAGQVVGMNTAIYSPSGGSVGIAFAIPASTVKTVVAQIRERGFVERGWIGVQVQPVTTAIAESLGMKETGGALVSGTEPGGPAAKAGLKAGDVVTSINGSVVKDPRDLARMIAQITPNTAVKVEFIRDSKSRTASITLGQLRDQTARRPAATEDQGSDRGLQPGRLGIAVAPASRVMGIGTQGLAVVRIDPNGTAAEAGLTQGDVILKVGAREMQSAQDLTNALDEAARHSKQHVLALVQRNDRNLFVALPVS
jgi:serine protease Do